MSKEISCGAIVYRKNNKKTEYLILLQAFSKTWSFPKGHMERGETRQETALRELHEEAGINAKLGKELQTVVSYKLNNGNTKYVYFYPAMYNGEICINNKEIAEYRWVDKKEALRLLPEVGYEKVFGEIEEYTMPQSQTIQHPIPPTYDENSKILILGSFPSVKSREMMYFYGHPQNRFWKVVSAVFGESTPETVEEKHAFLLRNHIAAWDVIAQCDIIGSSDSSIKNVVPNDLTTILDNSKVHQIFVNGKTAEKYFNKYTKPLIDREAICLPSTSPANAAWSLERLIGSWEIIREVGE